MSNRKNDLSLKDIYQLVDSTRRELNESIRILDEKFSTLEAGRLSNLETKFADFKGEMQGRNAIISGVVAFAISIIFIIINYFLK